jgi:hypothetical protein
LKDIVALRKLIIEAFTSRAWGTLGYESWDAYCDSEFRVISLGREHQAALNAALQHEAGMSARAAAAATGSSPTTAKKDSDRQLSINGQLDGKPPAAPPARRIGADGKSRPASRTRPAELYETSPFASPQPPASQEPPDENMEHLRGLVAERARVLAEVAHIASQPTGEDRLTHAVAAFRYAVGELLQCEPPSRDSEASEQVGAAWHAMAGWRDGPVQGNSEAAQQERRIRDLMLQQWIELGKELDLGELIAEYGEICEQS